MNDRSSPVINDVASIVHSQVFRRSDAAWSPGTVPVLGVRQHVAMYCDEEMENERVDLSRTLFILWAGGNDLNNDNTVSPAMVVTSLLNSVKDLLESGATKLVIFNRPLLHAFPSARKLDRDAFLISLTKQINDAFEKKLAELQNEHTNARMNMYNVHMLVIPMIDNRASIQFEYVTV